MEFYSVLAVLFLLAVGAATVACTTYYCSFYECLLGVLWIFEIIIYLVAGYFLLEKWSDFLQQKLFDEDPVASPANQDRSNQDKRRAEARKRVQGWFDWFESHENKLRFSGLFANILIVVILVLVVAFQYKSVAWKLPVLVVMLTSMAIFLLFCHLRFEGIFFTVTCFICPSWSESHYPSPGSFRYWTHLKGQFPTYENKCVENYNRYTIMINNIIRVRGLIV